ncbi:GABA(A) receptor-associated protein [Schistosoma bovis]|uniref:GABA(A) receptor-associated protein n=1 Tax=Schistosoma bovis TaxID=6184 RepID=A0A430QDJ9_SCHBO|nr:GABA(A) receptor-associated protein [Schistosoma bovis]
MKFQYKEDRPFEKRLEEGQNIRKKYPSSVPVGWISSSLFKNIMIVISSSTLHTVMKVYTDQWKTAYLHENSILEHHDRDLFLYIAYSDESIYGSVEDCISS